MTDYADKSAYRLEPERWLPSRDEWAVIAWCTAFIAVLAAIDWLAS